MGVETKIQWCHHTFNPWIGCARVSPGCEHCYAEAEQDHRYHRAKWGVHGTRHVTSDDNWKKPLKWDREAAAAGERRRVFCASLADVFEDRPELEAPRARLWGLIETTPHLDWLLLTKRPQNAMPLLKRIVRYNWPAMGGTYTADRWLADPLLGANVWLGTSVEDQRRADERIPALLDVPAAVRFLSIEPLLGPINLRKWIRDLERDGEDCDPGIDWVIAGGESGPHARSCDLAWIRSIRDQCEAAGVACFVKQLGSRPFEREPSAWPGGYPHGDGKIDLSGDGFGNYYVTGLDPKGGNIDEWPTDLQIREFPR